MNNMIKVQNEKFLESLPNHEEGEIAYLIDEKKCMIYSDGKWTAFTPKVNGEDNINLNLYDVNKQIISQLPPLSEQQLNDVIGEMNFWSKANAYMLYGKEISYFTLLQYKEEESINFGENIISLLKDITDTIYSIDVVNDDSIEIWINYEENPTVLYLFNYEGGIVNYGR
jgi:hypothetical protein